MCASLSADTKQSGLNDVQQASNMSTPAQRQHRPRTSAVLRLIRDAGWHVVAARAAHSHSTLPGRGTLQDLCSQGQVAPALQTSAESCWCKHAVAGAIVTRHDNNRAAPADGRRFSAIGFMAAKADWPTTLLNTQSCLACRCSQPAS